ncbi:MAG TPA: hypothetical protein VKG02_25610 [Blastocatellia bacterium]|nr:hypothetical protein [Blastocatellia bacterium]
MKKIMATAFGLRLLGTALVVHLDGAAMMKRKPTASLVQGFCRIGDDYQSGSKQPHSKGAADLIYTHLYAGLKSILKGAPIYEQ